MNFLDLHRWDVTPLEAIEIQNRLRRQLILDQAPAVIRTIAGVDVSNAFGSNRLFAAVVVLDLQHPQPKGFPILEVATASLEVAFPYVPGLLSFREIPVVLKAWEKLQIRPDCLMADGQGIAHPRRIGIASHLGLLVDLPSIGCGKTRLIGAHREPGPLQGEWSPLIDRGETIGAVLRTRDGVSPVFISPGHRMTLDRAVEIVLSSQLRYRLPEPTRMAHQLVNEARRAA
ncbi:deoxyribonuclease V [Candidatus Manganitrophus noduliformans]|uniref:Endonuclease V n=1 Tax=Candidatus Manganitrophus noduliformans TaxID=2606439 RepID=A0A7X6IC33_9BACT|nr:deoxyribonuclease V [Candidatus Manganitrophus noduliformans]NKE72263.1 deoxyribonuclease V [Candidatus Manganitrophus noduliformans]